MPALRTFLTCAVLLLLSVFPSRADETPKTEVYAKDVDFLLTELEQKAGGLFAVKGIDWTAVAKQFREEVKTVASDADHVKLCARLLARLQDGHASLAEVKVPMPDEAKGRRFTGPRVHLGVQGERVFVRAAFGSALSQGISIGAVVVKIDGLAARAWLDQRVAKMSDEQGFSTPGAALYAACHWGLADWEGTKITFELEQDGQTKSVEIIRNGGPNYAPFGPVFPPKDLKQIGRQSYGLTATGFAYIHLRDVPATLPEQLDTMLADIATAPGLILDMRANGGGGCDHAAVFGRFVPAGQPWRQYPSAGAHPFAGPMVVIVDPGVRSAGETIAGQFKEDGRAYMIGEGPTAGMSSQKAVLAAPSGMFSVRFSVASNKGRFNGGRGIEGLGVPPQEVVAYDPADLAKGLDTQIHRAEELFKAGLPKDRVPFEKERR